MATIKLKIDERNKTAKAFLEYIKTLSFVKIEEEETHYDPEFVKMIKEARASGNRTEINPKDVWGSLGLR